MSIIYKNGTYYGGGGAGAEITVDNELSSISENPVQNKVIKAELDNKQDADDLMTPEDIDDVVTPLPGVASRTLPRYSTEEQIVGYWIDGKPIYQKTFVLDNQITVSNASWTSTEIDVSYINVLVNINSPLATGQQNWFAVSASMQNNILYLLAARDNASAYIKYFTLQYTKTTD